MGQLRIMADNINMINYIFKYLDLNEIKNLNDDQWWSSTENIYYGSWFLDDGSTNYNLKDSYYYRIFPLFAIKKI
ncbi:MAG: hypothetical protein [Wendovervirus sonii]|uniref:Uncharacterized protein n=1 Tax=phage Lak_Megaphage_Sonny TaxID=3109229 RepID=A0ABZ0Z2H7_9CAUD|nr:MAG: hypothetical protein [phage Lak_Megaphage_Sonny]